MLATLTGTVPGVALPAEPEAAAREAACRRRPAEDGAVRGRPDEPEAVTEAEVVEAQDEAAAERGRGRRRRPRTTQPQQR